MNVITVARQLGSFGDWIAEQLAAKLDYEFIDRRLVEEIASITDTSVEEVERYDEKGEGRLRFFLKKLLVPEVAPGTFPLSAAAYAPEFGLEFPHMRDHEISEATYLDRGTYQLLITTLVQDFGQSGKAVVVGRASQVVLADFPNACHVKIIAPLETRIERLMQTRDMDREQAQKLIEQHDQWRQSYLRNFHKGRLERPPALRPDDQHRQNRSRGCRRFARRVLNRILEIKRTGHCFPPLPRAKTRRPAAASALRTADCAGGGSPHCSTCSRRASAANGP